MTQIQIYSNTKKALLLFIGSIAFVVLGYYIFLNAEEMTTYMFSNFLFFKIIGMFSMLFFGLGIVLSCKLFIKKQLLLVIDENGININPSKEEYIKWEDIEGFTELKINRIKMIGIQVSTPENYINKETNALRKTLMEFNMTNYHSPFSIAVSPMNISYKELFNILNENLIKNK